MPDAYSQTQGVIRKFGITHTQLSPIEDAGASGIVGPSEWNYEHTGGVPLISKTTDPTVNDDVNDGYIVGTVWINTTDDIAYISLDSTAGAAVWYQITAGGGWTSYTPTLTATVTNPTVVNGTLYGAYKLLGSKTCVIRINYIRGSSDTAGSGSWRIALPFSAVNGPAQMMPMMLVDQGTAYWIGEAVIQSGLTVLGDLVTSSPSVTSVIVTHNAPFTWATSDQIIINGIYEIG